MKFESSMRPLVLPRNPPKRLKNGWTSRTTHGDLESGHPCRCNGKDPDNGRAHRLRFMVSVLRMLASSNAYGAAQLSCLRHAGS
jgi:hypothetical protein